MPTNLYGPGDNFDLRVSHVVPALMRRIHEAKASGADRVTVWGSGAPRREFLHVDDLAAAAIYLMETWSAEQHVNVGTGRDVTIAELAETIQEIVGFRGRLAWDRSKPDGAPRKLLDVTRLTELGWRSTIDLHVGLAETYRWFLDTGRAMRGMRDRSECRRLRAEQEPFQNRQSATRSPASIART